MKIASTTLAGPGTEGIITDALRTVMPFVDACIVIQTSDDDAPMRVASDVCGDKLIASSFKWCDDFAAARNHALDTASMACFDWAFTIDTDERIIHKGENIRRVLESTAANCMIMYDAERSYIKERAFRLPAKAKFIGRTHESYPALDVGAESFGLATFSELRRNRDQLIAKFSRDASTLEAMTTEDPGNGRWWYYLGDSLDGLGNTSGAISAFSKCSFVSRWDEEGAWACYREALVYERLGERKAYKAMLGACSRGIGIHPGIAELYWLMGLAWLRLGEYEKAIQASHASIALGLYLGKGKGVNRIGFRFMPALYEGPFVVMADAYRGLGNQAMASDAETLRASASLARQSQGILPTKPPPPPPPPK